MPKLTHAQITQLLNQRSKGKITFFESMRYNYGSYSAAGKALGIPGRTLQEIAEAPKGYDEKISDARLNQVQKAIGKMSRGNYDVASRFFYAKSTGTTPGQIRYMEVYTKKKVGQTYFRKTVNDYYNNKTKRVLMPALTSEGKIVGVSPTMKKTKRRGKRRAVRGRRR